MQHAYIQLIFNFSIFKVQKGHERSSHGHERSYGKAQKKNVFTNDILGCSAFFWYTSCISFETLSFEVIRGQWRSAWGQSFDLSLVWTYFHCNTAVFSFHLICNMPIFKWFLFFYFFEVCKLRSKTLTIVPRSNEVMDTKSDARFGKYGSK